jgi:competence protein ComEC
MNRSSWIRLILLIFALSSAAPAGENLTAHFIDVGQGDSILLQFNGKNILIDGGIQEMGPRVEAYLRDNGVSSLDLLILTHPHDDHIGGLMTILKDLPVKQVLDNGQPNSSLIYGLFKTLIDQKNISYGVARRGQEINIDKALKIYVLSPPLAPFSGGLNHSSQAISKIPWESMAVRVLSGDLNQNSLVLRVTYGAVSILLMGDADTLAEKSLISSGSEIKSDILKVGHHGGSSASSTNFLSSVMPSVSIIEVGKANYYGYPTSKTLSALRGIGSKIYRTDTSGNIIMTTDGLNYSLITQKNF